MFILDVVAITRKITCNSFFLQSFNSHFFSTNQCEQPTDLAYQKCSSQQQCVIYVPNTPLVGCQNLNADYLDVEYICLPGESLFCDHLKS